jgi:hypothetical protein
MLGIDDPMIIIGYALSIGLAAACVLYGWLKKERGEKHNG